MHVSKQRSRIVSISLTHLCAIALYRCLLTHWFANVLTALCCSIQRGVCLIIQQHGPHAVCVGERDSFKMVLY